MPPTELGSTAPTGVFCGSQSRNAPVVLRNRSCQGTAPTSAGPRRAHVLDRLVTTSVLSTAQAETARNAPLGLQNPLDRHVTLEPPGHAVFAIRKRPCPGTLGHCYIIATPTAPGRRSASAALAEGPSAPSPPEAVSITFLTA